MKDKKTTDAATTTAAAVTTAKTTATTPAVITREDVCPTEQPDWENNAACDMKPLGGCNCTYSDNSQCFFRCMDGKWYMSEGCFIFFPDCTLNRYYIDKSK